MKASFWIAFALGAIALGIYYSPARAETNSTPACGSISADTTWQSADSPFDVCVSGVSVAPNVTLTIQPGVVVQFENAPGNTLSVQGALDAIGTPAQPITFTGVITDAGSWGGLSINGSPGAPGVLRLDHATLEYAGVNGPYGAQVYADQAVITITNSLIREGGGNGIYADQNTQFEVRSTRFEGNALQAVKLASPATDLALSDLSASGNGGNGVYLGGTVAMKGQRHWDNPGIPYLVDAPVSNQAGDMLSIAPGSDLEFSGGGWLAIGGQFSALGSESLPITLTAQTQTPGAWRGLTVYGGTQQAAAQLDHVTIEYGGSDIHGADIEVEDGVLTARNSIIRYSSKDGVRFDPNGGGSILDSQVYGNALYGVWNEQTERAVLAAEDWWGDPSGPQSDLPACGAGTGDKVTAGVLFQPYLSDAANLPPFPLSDAPILTLTPRRWFAPADSQTRVYFDISLRDGNGYPIAGRTVKLHSSLGTVWDGGVTDTSGRTLAYLTSASPGDANVTAALEASTSCEATLTPQAKVTFTTPVNLTELFPNSPAPYLSDDISVSPLPVISGVTTTVKATLTNPLSQPITVDVAFEYAQTGIGLAYGPISVQNGLVVAANSSLPLQASFVPPISGHYCVQVSYTITAIGGAALQAPMDGGSGLMQFNWDAKQGPFLPQNSKDSLNKADKAFKAVGKLPAGPTQIQKAMVTTWWDKVKDTASKISQSLGFDPPRQDYTTPTMPVWHSFAPVQPDANISAQRAAALNAVSDALLKVDAYGTAATTALDRYGGASAAGNLTWATAQSNEMLYYIQQLGSALMDYADKLDAFVAVLQAEGETQTVISVDDVIAYQTRLATSGFTEQEIAEAHQAGLTDENIEAHRQEIIATNPADIAGDLLTIYTGEAAQARETGDAILHPAMFNVGFHVGGGAGLEQAASAGNVMAQVFNTTETIQVSNPLAQAATIDLSIRRIDLPADWVASVSPAQVTLAPGELATATISILSGAPLPQGSQPRVAVEGYAAGQLLGGVVVDVVVPLYAPFDGSLHLYMPVIMK